jgi:hypothetical protein
MPQMSSKLVTFMTLATAAALLCVLPDAHAATTQPSVITLQVKDAPAKQVFEDLARQASAALPTSPPDLFQNTSLPNVTADLTRQPFWAAIKQLGSLTGVGPVPTGDDPYPRMILGVGGGFWDEPHAISGPVVVFANDVSATADVELTRKGHAIRRQVAINLTAFVEPGLRVVSVAPVSQIKEAVDENGKALRAATDPADEGLDDDALSNPQHSDQPGTRVWSWNSTLLLDLPEGAGRKIARLKGVTGVRVATAVQPIEFLDVMKTRGATRPVAGTGATLTFKNLMKADIEYVLRIHLRRDKAPQKEWDLLSHSIYNGMMALYDDKGRLVADRCTENGGEYAKDKLEATFRFVREPGVSHPQAGEPYKLIWQAPTAAKDLPIEFELTDLPIPE